MITSLIGAIAAGSILLGGAPTDTPNDDAFAFLVREGLSSSHGNVPDSVLRTAAESVCEALDSGASTPRAVQLIRDGFNESDPNDPLTTNEAAYFVGAAIGAYCPWHINGSISY